MKISIKTLTIIFLSFFISEVGFAQSQNHYDVKTGANNGLRFWNGNDNYKIAFGNTSPFKYGPVNSYSIKHSMSSHSGRGWTWGLKDVKPVAALENTGNFQVAGWLRTMDESIKFGASKSLHSDNSNSLVWKGGHSTISRIKITDKEGKRYGSVYGNINGTYFGLLDGDDNWSYVTKKDEWTQLKVDDIAILSLYRNGKVRIGNVPFSSNDYKLFVEKGIITEVMKVAVKSSSDWSDYVFNEDYKLMPLSDLRDFLKTEKHLPNVPSAAEMVENGLDVAKSDAVLLEKIEEAHLYILKLHEQMEKMNTQIAELQKQVNENK